MPAKGATSLQLLAKSRDIHSSILVEETIFNFGHNPRYLKPSSMKSVFKKFDCCGKIEERKFRYAQKQHVCLECSNKVNAQKDTGRNKRSLFMKARNLDPSYKHPTKGIGHSDEARAKISQAHIGKRLGKNSSRYGKSSAHGKWSQANTSRGYLGFRSTWEKKVALYLDSVHLSWVYEPKAFEIIYEFEGRIKEGTYRPDFYINCWGIFVEVKGWWRDDARNKFDAFCEQYQSLSIEVWDEFKLKSLGIL